MWGVIPAAGAGSRIQPLAFSKELLPVGSRFDHGVERPRAVSEYLIDRMICGGANKICFVISPGKSDIMEYYGGSLGAATFSYVVQPKPAGLCDALFRSLPLIPANEDVLFGLPDTIWYPENGFNLLPPNVLSFLCFPVDQPQFFDAVCFDDKNRVTEIQVKKQDARSNWVWGAFRMSGKIFNELYDLWREPGRGDEYMGTLVNEWLARGGKAVAVPHGVAYVDVGTLNGYREAIHLLSAKPSENLVDRDVQIPETSLAPQMAGL